MTFLVLYVDDRLIIGNDILTLQGVKSWLDKCFSMKDLGEVVYILAIKIYRDKPKRLLVLSESAYIHKFLKWFKMEHSKREFVPMEHGTILCSTQSASTWIVLENMRGIPYGSTNGSIMYSMLYTKCDVSCALSMKS